MTPLSDHFSLAELTASQTASRRGIDNTPTAKVLERLRNTAAQMEKVRTILGNKVISVSSGYRSPTLNTAIGGVKTSAHLTGDAVDFNCYAFDDPLAVCKVLAASDLKFDQLIEEGTWVHISFAPQMRRQVLTKTTGGYAAGLR